MIRKLPSTEGAYYVEKNGHGVVRYNEGVIDLLYIDGKHIKLARLLEKHTLPIVFDFILNLDNIQDYTFEETKLSANKKEIINNIFFNYIGDYNNEDLYRSNVK